MTDAWFVLKVPATHTFVLQHRRRWVKRCPRKTKKALKKLGEWPETCFA